VPTYDFRCPNGHSFERFYRTISTAPSELECPECHATAQRQISGGAGLAFKGSGFYLTDYGKNAHRKADPGKKAEGGSDAAKSDSKPASTDATPKAADKAAPSSKPKTE
jgi:putative FmdB family regulatory protein